MPVRGSFTRSSGLRPLKMAPRLVLFGSIPIFEGSLAQQGIRVARLVRRLVQNRDDGASCARNLNPFQQANTAIDFDDGLNNANHDPSDTDRRLFRA